MRVRYRSEIREVIPPSPAFSAHEPGGGRRQIAVYRVKIPQAWLRNSRLQHQATLHISGA
jgi:hypothetical protein